MNLQKCSFTPCYLAILKITWGDEFLKTLFYPMLYPEFQKNMG